MAIISLFKFSSYPMSVSAQPEENRPSKYALKWMKITSINFVYQDLWSPTASRLQGLTVMQQRIYQMTFRNVYKFKKQLVNFRLVWSITLSILLSMKWKNRIHACVCTMNQHFDQFYCRQLKNETVGQSVG